MIGRIVLVSVLILIAIHGAGHTTNLTVATIEGNTPYATEAYIYQTNTTGPAAIVLGGLHGDEPAGWLTASRLRNLAVKTGTLIIIPKANQLAVKAGERTLPEIGDINRSYPGSPDGIPAERIAASIVELMKKYNVTMLIDLHEAGNYHRFDPESLGQSIVFAEHGQSAVLALDAVTKINKQITEPYKQFTYLSPPIEGSSAYYAGARAGIPAFTIETSVAQPIDDRVAQQYLIAKYLLAAHGVVDYDDK